MIICFIIEYYPPHIGGGETLFKTLVEGLVKHGHQCDVITCMLTGTEKYEVKNGVNIHRVKVPGFADRYWFTFLAIYKSIKITRGADIIHTMTYNGAFPAWLASKVNRKPIVILPHEVLGKKWYTFGFNRLSAILYRLFEWFVLSLKYNIYICNSKNTMKALKGWGIPVKKLHLIYPGIDYNLFDYRKEEKRQEIREKLGIRNNTFVYMYHGRPGMIKGVEYLVRAVPEIKRRIQNSKLLLILAKKPVVKYREIIEIIQKENLDVILIDPLPHEELPYYIAASDCVVVPSLHEGFGFTCVEACTMKKPVVATNVGSLPEVISGRYILVEPKNPEELAIGVEKIYNGKYVSTEVKTFSWEDTINSHMELYRKVLNESA
ncbi:MAG: glycosyltransferase family 4 protein [Nitrospirota bacterium]